VRSSTSVRSGGKDTGRLFVARAASGGEAEISLAHPPNLEGSVVVGKFHTHPHPESEGWDLGPSRRDRMNVMRDLVPAIIRSEAGYQWHGPLRRVGGLSGPPGYPTLPM
jgi:hypothetical protein